VECATEYSQEEASLIIVVEDDAEIRVLIDQILKLRGYNVVTLKNGEEALIEIERQPCISLLLTDIRMPGISGWELARRAVEARAIKVMYITGYLGEIPDDSPHAPLLRKPWGLRDFYMCVESLIGPPHPQ
jgi:CheY-like chemotaxis protein